MSVIQQHILPSYEDSLKNFIQPPSYHTALVTNPESYDPLNRQLVNEFLKFHQFTRLRFLAVDSTELDTHQELVLDYTIVSNEYILDLKKSVDLLVRDKLVQIERNSRFVKNNVKTLHTNYFIDKLRNTTLANFHSIYEKLQMELMDLDNLFNCYLKYNTQYECVLNNQLLYREEKSNIRILNNLRHNLSLIKQRISVLSCTNDISYILKERARIYNDAKQVVENQRRSSSTSLRSLNVLRAIYRG
ncbi:hypothetical protein WICPIJ_007465 [Wickerhamomyces pijperi]|uniref:Uncharacterized protein n=1 Tax=Wickerhamomyces pijperi TaxID=599730 RepID=A0A9P8TKF3_WICPI|nr:hypothetical protein WICPIJ_007465 [Wickerhamomyces pijperi]